MCECDNFIFSGQPDNVDKNMRPQNVFNISLRVKRQGKLTN